MKAIMLIHCEWTPPTPHTCTWVGWGNAVKYKVKSTVKRVWKYFFYCFRCFFVVTTLVCSSEARGGSGVTLPPPCTSRLPSALTVDGKADDGYYVTRSHSTMAEKWWVLAWDANSSLRPHHFDTLTSAATTSSLGTYGKGKTKQNKTICQAIKG